LPGPDTEPWLLISISEAIYPQLWAFILITSALQLIAWLADEEGGSVIGQPLSIARS